METRGPSEEGQSMNVDLRRPHAGPTLKTRNHYTPAHANALSKQAPASIRVLKQGRTPDIRRKPARQRSVINLQTERASGKTQRPREPLASNTATKYF